TSKVTVTRLTESQVSLDDFEVVGSAQVPCLDGRVLATVNSSGVADNRTTQGVGTNTGRAVFSSSTLDLERVVRQSNSQGAVCVAKTGRDGTLVGVISARFFPLLAAVNVERVADAELEAREVRGLIHDHVVIANRVHSGESCAHVGLSKAQTERIDGAEVLRANVGLTTEVQLTPSVASQTQSGLTTEQAVTLSVFAGTQIEAAFQLEHSAQAVAQIFSTLN